MLSCEDILGALPLLTKEGLARVAAATSLLLPKSPAAIDEGLLELHAALGYVLETRVPPLPMLLRGPTNRLLRAASARVTDLLARNPKLRRVERAVVLQALIRLCIVERKALGQTEGLVPVCIALSAVNDVVERAFPGYAETGMLLPALLGRRDLCRRR